MLFERLNAKRRGYYNIERERILYTTANGVAGASAECSARCVVASWIYIAYIPAGR